MYLDHGCARSPLWVQTMVRAESLDDDVKFLAHLDLEVKLVFITPLVRWRLHHDADRALPADECALAARHRHTLPAPNLCADAAKKGFDTGLAADDLPCGRSYQHHDLNCADAQQEDACMLVNHAGSGLTAIVC
jgi:hypothetical protein